MQTKNTDLKKRTQEVLIWVVGSILLFMVLSSAIPIVLQIVNAVSRSPQSSISTTSTPSADTVLNEAKGAADKADQEAAQTQSILNVINFIAVAFTAVLAIASVIGLRGFRELESEGRSRIGELDKKREAIETLQKETEERLKAIGDLQTFVELQKSVTKSIEDTNKALLYLILGNQLVEQNKVSEAIETYEKVKALQPHDPLVNYALGRTYSAIESFDKAIECLEISVANDSGFAQAHFELGLAYRRRADKRYSNNQKMYDDEYDKAIEQIKIAVKLLPTDEEIVASLGGTYRRAKDYRNALRYYNQSLAINPNSSYAMGNVAILAWHEGDLATARDTFKRTKELATKRITARTSYEPYWDYYDRGMAELVLGQKEEAMNDYRLAISLTRNSEHFKTVIDYLKFLEEVEDRYPIDGLEEALLLVGKAKADADTLMIAKAL